MTVKIAIRVVILTTMTGLFGAQAAEFSSKTLPLTIKGMDSKNQIANQYIVMYKTNAITAAMTNINKQLKVQNFNQLKGFAATLNPQQLHMLQTNPNIQSIEVNQHLILPEPPLTSVGKSATINSWGIDRLDQSQLPLDNNYQVWGNGSGVHAYIIDSGIRVSHQDFAGRAQWNFTAPDITDGNDDGFGHGTHMAATVGGTTYGVAKNVTIHGVKVLNNQGVGSLAGLIAGIDYVTANHQKPAVAVIGLSTDHSPALNAAIETSSAAGVSYALAGGDHNKDACSYSPGSTSAAGVIAVAATASDDSASNSANYGPCIDVFAPGLYIKSAWHLGDYYNNTISHSPMAAAHVAGAAALIRGNDPDCNVAQVKNQLLGNSYNNQVTNMPANTSNRLLGVARTASSSQSCGSINTTASEIHHFPAALVCDRTLVDGATPNNQPNYHDSKDLSVGRNSFYVRSAALIECDLPYKTNRYVKRVSLEISEYNGSLVNCTLSATRAGISDNFGTTINIEKRITNEYSMSDLGVLPTGSTLSFACPTPNTSTETRDGYTRFWRATVEYAVE